MTCGDKNFPVRLAGLGPGEEVLRCFHRHRVLLFSRLVVPAFFVVAGAAGLVAPVEPELARAGAAAAGILFLTVGVQLFFLRILNHGLKLVILTNHRLIVHKKTIFTREDTESLPLKGLMDIHGQCRGFFQNLLGYGHIHLGPELVLPFVPEVGDAVRQILEAKETLESDGAAPGPVDLPPGTRDR